MEATKRPSLSLPLRYEKISPEKRTGKGSSKYKEYAFEILSADIYQPNDDLIFCVARIPFGSVCNIGNEEEIAHLIVTAVNLHGEMLDVIRQFVTAYEHRQPQLGNGQARRSFEKFRALLAKLKEGD